MWACTPTPTSLPKLLDTDLPPTRVLCFTDHSHALTLRWTTYTPFQNIPLPAPSCTFCKCFVQQNGPQWKTLSTNCSIIKLTVWGPSIAHWFIYFSSQDQIFHVCFVGSSGTMHVNSSVLGNSAVDFVSHQIWCICLMLMFLQFPYFGIHFAWLGSSRLVVKKKQPCKDLPPFVCLILQRTQ